VVLLKNLKNIFAIPELKRKLAFTLGVIIVHQLGSFIPVIGVDMRTLTGMLQQVGQVGSVLQYLDIFTGGSLSRCTLFALGISPFITASIMMQLLSMSVPTLEQLMKEGEYGRKIINQYTRYLALGLSIMYSWGYATVLESNGLVLNPGLSFKLLFVLSLSAGAMFVMWLSEQIDRFGIGNGSSIIIFTGILSQFPNHVIKTIGWVQLGNISVLTACIILAFFLILTASIVFFEKGERRVPVQYSRRVIGKRVYQGESTYIPFQINPAGIMPVIFATTFLNLPSIASSFLAQYFDIFKTVSEALHQGGWVYNCLTFVLIFFFTYAYTAIIFQPPELADQMKKSGGFVPGIRPGKKTEEYFNYILDRIGLIGAFYLGVLAILPSIFYAFVQVPFQFGGTQLLIIVGVALEVSAQIESYLVEHRYEGFLSSGRLQRKGAM